MMTRNEQNDIRVDAGIASIAAGKLNDLSGAIAESNPTGNADVNSALGNIVATVIATGGGAVVGGDAGAFSVYNADRYNRQLHPEEKTRAKQLADKSDGKYSQAQIEDQMRIMGATINGKSESAAPDTLIGQTAPIDTVANWQYAGKTADGNPILTQINAAIDPELQSYIRNNYASVGAGVPGIVTSYVPSSKLPKLGPMIAPISTAGTICPLGDCGIAVYGPSKNQVADTASSISVAAGRFGVATTVAAEIPSPYSPVFASAAFAATVVGWVAGGLEQVLRPNVGQYTFSTTLQLGAQVASDRLPLASPAINETAEILNNGPISGSVTNWINSQWGQIDAPDEETE